MLTHMLTANNRQCVTICTVEPLIDLVSSSRDRHCKVPSADMKNGAKVERVSEEKQSQQQRLQGQIPFRGVHGEQLPVSQNASNKAKEFKRKAGSVVDWLDNVLEILSVFRCATTINCVPQEDLSWNTELKSAKSSVEEFQASIQQATAFKRLMTAFVCGCHALFSVKGRTRVHTTLLELN